ncbi:MAG: ATPase, T2SS/T4P/T4SS family [Planctomycetota bacterium]|jgi:type II secretory ATPase GspE/PulE/Tfp pilus assembly ATPase PilB-like protein|nr:ATPase, T2SS/T4P/T4SS family [Planctomycetota bacterium]
MDGAEWIETLLADLPATEASDLILEPQDDGSLVAKVRCQGLCRELRRCPPGIGKVAIARLKAIAGLPAYITEQPQDGRIDGAPFGIDGDCRFAVLPTVRGGRVALRLPALGALPEPQELGLPTAVLDALRAQVRSADGLVLLTGPTGSGKTTTIHSLLRELANERVDRQILTIEDPVERLLPGIAQVEVRAHRGDDFAGTLRAALRQDVDVIVVGEIRDQDTALTAVQAALCGHMVIATMHTGRAREAVPRLLSMGVADHLLLPALRGVLSQRLVRLIHEPCRGEGCGDCVGGYRGRQVICDYISCTGADPIALKNGAAVEQATMEQQIEELVASRRTHDDERLRVLA